MFLPDWMMSGAKIDLGRAKTLHIKGDVLFEHAAKAIWMRFYWNRYRIVKLVQTLCKVYTDCGSTCSPSCSYRIEAVFRA